MSNIESNKQAVYLDYVLTIKQFFNRHRSGGYMFAVSYNYPLKREINREVIEYCSGQELSVGETALHFDEDKSCLQQLQAAKEQFENGLILTNVDELMLLTHDEFAYQLNQMREALFALHIPILIWLSPENHSAFTHKAIDLYSRRDLDTIFFPDIAVKQDDALFERSEMQLGQEEDAETLRTRIALLENQLQAARQDEVPRKRIANEIVFPLIKAYRQLLLLNQAVMLIEEFQSDFIYSDRQVLVEFGKIYQKAGSLDISINYFEKALQVDLKIKGKMSGNIADDYNKLGLVWKEKGNPKKAIVYFEEALSMSQKLLGKQHPNIAASYNNLGGAWQDAGKIDKAIKFYNKCLEIEQSIFGKTSSETATALNNVAGAWHDKRDFDKSIHYYKESLVIFLNLFGENNQNVAALYNNLGLNYLDKDDPKLAIDYYKKSLEIRLRIFGENSPITAITYNNLGSAFYAIWAISQARIYFTKAHNILSKTYGSEHAYTKNLLNKIVSIENEEKAGIFIR